MLEKLRIQMVLQLVCLKSLASYSTVIYTYHQQLMESVGSNGSLLLAFMMNVTDWQFVSNSHKVMTAHIVMLSSKCCSRNFSAISTTMRSCSEHMFGYFVAQVFFICYLTGLLFHDTCAVIVKHSFQQMIWE